MRILLTVGLSALVTVLAVTAMADDPFGLFELWQSTEPLDQVEPSPQMLTPTSSSTRIRGGKSSTKAPALNAQGSGDNAIRVRELEELVHQIVNLQRQKNELSSLGYDANLATIARNHSADMATLDYFEHRNLAGEEPSDRGARQGYDCRKDYGTHYTIGIAENIYQGWLYSSITYVGFTEQKNWSSTQEIAQDVVVGWMNSPGHRANIVNDAYDLEGIGVAIAADNRIYVTQNFC